MGIGIRVRSNFGIKMMAIGIETTLFGRFIFESEVVFIAGGFICLLGVLFG